MISYIYGEIKELTPTYIILDCNGMGYFLNISLTTFSKVESCKDDRIKIFTHLHIREDAHTLFGFLVRITYQPGFLVRIPISTRRQHQ